MPKELGFYSRKTGVQTMYNNCHLTLDMKSIIQKVFVNDSCTYGAFLAIIKL